MNVPDGFVGALGATAVLLALAAVLAAHLRHRDAERVEEQAKSYLDQARHYLQWADDALKDAKAHYKASAAVLHDIDERVVEMRKLVEIRGHRR